MTPCAIIKSMSIARIEKTHDLLVIGGGINGCGIALDAAGRGLSVILCEKNDLGSGTSSNSTKLIHGGLRYLEHYDFKLVRESLNERQILLSKAPHLISPLRFVIPHEPSLRPYWMIRLGLWLYDHLGKTGAIEASQGLTLSKTSEYGQPLIARYTQGFAYTDCWVDDARLVLANAQGAAELGATILSYTRVNEFKPVDGTWEVELEDTFTGEKSSVRARALVNASGPWIGEFPGTQAIRLVRGSHIIVPKTYKGNQAYLIQHPDGRVVFVIPYENDFTLIGTTECDAPKMLDTVKISLEEKNYLINLYNEHFEEKISLGSLVWDYAGVRPLINGAAKSATALSREYLLDLQTVQSAPILSIYGGKITTYRTLAEACVNRLAPYFPKAGPAWTQNTPLPGGDLGAQTFDEFYHDLQKQYSFLPSQMLLRMAKQYGTRIHLVLSEVHSLNDLGHHFEKDCYAHELEYLVQQEWAKTPEDMLFRRSKWGLHLSQAAQQKIKTWLEQKMSL